MVCLWQLQPPLPWPQVPPVLPLADVAPKAFYPEVSEAALSLQDSSTNLAVLTGSSGVGRVHVAAALARELVETGHWEAAYWLDFQGVTSHKLACE